MKTPKKIIFPLKKQREILSQVKKILKPISKNKSVKRILIGGSFARMELGKYEREYHGKLYSDIDVFVVADGDIKIPSSFREDYALPEKIAKITRRICFRYISKKSLEGKLPIHIHIFNPNIHNRKLALKHDFQIDHRINKKKAILIYERSSK
jgi:predicted nucleotidyltransferase